MSDPFRKLQGDRVRIERPDGSLVTENYPASIQRNKIYLTAGNLSIEPGYEISRKIAGGVVETYVVEDPGFYPGMGGRNGIPPNYQMTVRRKDAPQKATGATYSVSGPNARMNIGSHDASHNVVYQDAGALFDALLQALQGITDEAERGRVIAEAEELRGAVGSPSFAESYRAFIASAADYITILTPFIAPLTALIPGHH